MSKPKQKCICGLGDKWLHACGVIPHREGVGGVFVPKEKKA
jgi:hypothetical protein